MNQQRNTINILLGEQHPQSKVSIKSVAKENVQKSIDKSLEFI